MGNGVTAEKQNGRIYTPMFIVENILDIAGYKGGVILKKHVMDNSCGDGVFLCVIVERYCEAAIANGYNPSRLKKELGTFVHGIEIEASECERCIQKLSLTAGKYGIEGVKWDVKCEDTLLTQAYDGKMDFVLGNPPYVRIHNLESRLDVKKFSFAKKGMTDLYIAFFEIGIRMLKKNGILGYITPNSYFHSLAGMYMREYLVENKLLKAVVDLRHFQAFSATTYTAITVLEKGRGNGEVELYHYDEKTHSSYYVDTLLPQDFKIDGRFFFSKRTELAIVKKIINNTKESDITVKNGYATLCDRVFVNDFSFDSEYIIPVIKASTGIKKRIIYPYDCDANPISEEELKKDAELYKYLCANRERLIDRSNEKNDEEYWYLFGRSQAVGDTYRDKLALNSLLRNGDDFKFVNAPAGTGVYGGLYIISPSVPQEKIADALKGREFMAYIEHLGKYKSGGYYTFSSKDVKAYLDYKFGCERGDF